MGRLYTASGAETLTFESAVSKDETWDVFVSHRSGDDDLADEVARCIRSFGLTAWVDSDYLQPSHDGPDMAFKIGQVIGRSFCLMAVVTTATSSSWWVPFEIGIAWNMERFLSTYGASEQRLPSFLSDWPRVKNHSELHEWCDLIKDKKGVHVASFSEGFARASSSQRSEYVKEMAAMARRFSALR